MRILTSNGMAGLAIALAVCGCSLASEDNRHYLLPPALPPVSGNAAIFTTPTDPLGLPAGLLDGAKQAEAIGNYSGALGATRSAREQLAKQASQDPRLSGLLADLDREIARLDDLVKHPPQGVSYDQLLARTKALASPAPGSTSP